uniref:Late embryogenesis abundant protein LEA-2 subgroup domain-containing protein n=1 Tax=Triticum urartu TaxID=4572 RepID=A0A8R7Q7V4_TRIUA
MAPAVGAEEQDVPLFHPSPCAYYVQSPSAASHTLSHPASESTALILSPFPETAFAAPRRSDDAGAGRHEHDQEASRLALSRYSSSRGSNNSFLTDKKPSGGGGSRGARQVLRVVSGRSDDDDGVGADQRSGAWRYVKLDPEAPCCCIAFQVAWRVAVSMAIALLVFVVVTRPAHPGVSFKVGKVERFSLGEGLDGSGVITSFLNCNCSVEMAVENHSKVFSLHLLPLLLDMSFGHFTFAASQQVRIHRHVHVHCSGTPARLVVCLSPCVIDAGRGAARRRRAAGRYDGEALRGGAGEADVRGGARHAGPARVRQGRAGHHRGAVAVSVPRGWEHGPAHVPPRLPVRAVPQEEIAVAGQHPRRRRPLHLLRSNSINHTTCTTHFFGDFCTVVHCSCTSRILNRGFHLPLHERRCSSVFTCGNGHGCDYI